MKHTKPVTKKTASAQNDTVATTQAYVLPVTLTIETIEETGLALRSLSEDRNTLRLDASCVEIITSPGIRLLLALAETLEQKGGRLIVRGKSNAFTDAFALAGLSSILAAWEA